MVANTFNPTLLTPPTLPAVPAQPSIISNGPLYSPPPKTVTGANVLGNGIPPAQRRLLQNGASAFLQQRPHSRQSKLDVILPIGPALNGPRTLIPQILTTGSAEIKTYLNAMGRNGVKVDAFAQGDSVVLSLLAPTQSQNLLPTVALKLLTQSSIDPNIFNTERNTLLNNFMQQQALPEVRLNNLITENLYGKNHPYSETKDLLMRQIQVQTPTTVLNVLRQGLSQTNQVALNWVSAQTPDAMQQNLNNALRSFNWYGGAVNPQSVGKSPPVTQAITKPWILLPDNSLKRAHIQVAWRVPNVDDPDYATFLVLFHLLDGFNGRFFQQLRTRQGLVYSTQQTYENYRQAAEYRLNMDVDFSALSEALQGVHKVLEGDLGSPGLLSHYVTDRELTRAKKAFTLGTRDAIQTATGLASFNLPSILMDQNPVVPNQLINQIEAVTDRDVYAMARRVFGVPNNRITGITAPNKVLTTFAQAQGIPLGNMNVANN
jgi:predicted Zn-dependent peptidase